MRINNKKTINNKTRIKKLCDKRKRGGSKKNKKGTNGYESKCRDYLHQIHDKISLNDLDLKKEYADLGRLLYKSQSYVDATIIPYSEDIQNTFINLVNNPDVIQNEDVKWHILYIFYRINAVQHEKEYLTEIDPSVLEPEPDCLASEHVVAIEPVIASEHVVAIEPSVVVPLFFIDSNEKLIAYWKDIFSKATKTDYNLHEFKQRILAKMKTSSICEEIQSFNQYYSVSETATPYSQTYCTLFFIIGTLTQMLKNAETCILLLKGGKAIQFTANIVSDDIDVLITPLTPFFISNTEFYGIKKG